MLGSAVAADPRGLPVRRDEVSSGLLATGAFGALLLLAVVARATLTPSALAGRPSALGPRALPKVLAPVLTPNGSRTCGHRAQGCCAHAQCGSGLACDAGTCALFFSGYAWDVKAGTDLGPGHTDWSSNNVRVDAAGALHLGITRVGNTCYSAELSSRRRFSFGRFQWWVEGPISSFDPKAVLGLFLIDDRGPKGKNEIDIEYSRWGNLLSPPGNFVVWPAPGAAEGCPTGWRLTIDPGGWHCKFSFPTPFGRYTTQRFTWSRGNISFDELGGFYADQSSAMISRAFAPADRRFVPAKTMNLHISYWAWGEPDTHPVTCPPNFTTPPEIIIHRFTYVPESGPALVGLARGAAGTTFAGTNPASPRSQ